jgi:hypothetical protein
MVPDRIRYAALMFLDGLQMHWLMEPDTFDLRRQWAIVADALFAAS